MSGSGSIVSRVSRAFWYGGMLISVIFDGQPGRLLSCSGNSRRTDINVECPDGFPIKSGHRQKQGKIARTVVALVAMRSGLAGQPELNLEGWRERGESSQCLARLCWLAGCGRRIHRSSRRVSAYNSSRTIARVNCLDSDNTSHHLSRACKYSSSSSSNKQLSHSRVPPSVN